MMSAKKASRKRIALGVLGFVVLAGLWFAFRPEKLFTNKRVNEAPPAQASTELTPLRTGRFVSLAHPTTGRATVYQGENGTRELRLTDFSTSNGPAVHVLLIDGHDPGAAKNFTLDKLKNVDLGELKETHGDQEFRISGEVDLRNFSTVSIYCERYNINFGSATLEDF
jgi:Electron transfer DM13